MGREEREDSLVVSGVWDATVHPQFVALHLVELVSGVGILSRLHHRRPHVQVLIKVLPPDLPWKTHPHKNFYLGGFREHAGLR